jgi:hypothetical protein
MRKQEMKKTEARKNEHPGSVKDKLDISPAGRELLNTKAEAAREENLEKVRLAGTLDDARLEQIRDRIEHNFYDNPDIIEKILDKLMELPSFQEHNDVSGFEE